MWKLRLTIFFLQNIRDLEQLPRQKNRCRVFLLTRKVLALSNIQSYHIPLFLL